MRLVKPSATLTAAFMLWVAGSLCGATALLHAEARPEEKPTASAQAAPAKTPAKAPEKAPVAKAPAAKAPAKSVAKQPGKAPAKAAEAPQSTFRRDPFQPLISKAEPGKTAIPENLPPGPGGLMVSTLKLEGIVRAPSGMIAVVSNPQGRVYFIREGASLYDGTVEKISLDSMTMRERGKDPFGKPVDRQVVKRLYPRAGEQ